MLVSESSREILELFSVRGSHTAVYENLENLKLRSGLEKFRCGLGGNSTAFYNIVILSRFRK